MRRGLGILMLVVLAALMAPAAAWAHEAPETDQSRWVMVDWMLETFFIFAGVALAGFLWAWKAGHFHNLEQQASIPLRIHEEDYYTPEWAFDEEEWDDVDAER
ncbi:MAG TPA: cbb3-type cytochrome oxidase assembly protein CcoS [Gaiellaceae bacterium]|jgi:nitrogen fixation-related uncharacterized protein|nr:cbb3-type cytochrome oxidase assembly protein CcoS [Gaiellaceae bacterium]